MNLLTRISASPMIANYRKMVPSVRPYWVRAVMAVLITLPIGSFDALTAWILKPFSLKESVRIQRKIVA